MSQMISYANQRCKEVLGTFIYEKHVKFRNHLQDMINKGKYQRLFSRLFHSIYIRLIFW